MLPGITSRNESILGELADSTKIRGNDCSVLLLEGDMDIQIQNVISRTQIYVLVLALKRRSTFSGVALT